MAGTAPDPPGEGTGPAAEQVPRGAGSMIRRLSWLGTAVYVVVAVAATIWPDRLPGLLVAVCTSLFTVGMVAFAAAYVIAIGRSRTEAIGMGGLYFLAGSAPSRVRASLLGSFAVQTAVATVTASIGLAVFPADRDNLLAFGVLTPIFGLGLAGLWGARHGVFAPRPPTRRRPSSADRAQRPPSADPGGRSGAAPP